MDGPTAGREFACGLESLSDSSYEGCLLVGETAHPFDSSDDGRHRRRLLAREGSATSVTQHPQRATQQPRKQSQRRPSLIGPHSTPGSRRTRDAANRCFSADGMIVLMGWASSRRRIAIALLVVTMVILPAACASSVHHPGGDPNGRLIAELAPTVRVVPSFEVGTVPWISFPCDACKFPKKYAIKIEPAWDGCDGRAGTFGWDPAIIQIGFVWIGASEALDTTLNFRLSSEGWARGASPSWSEDQSPDPTWDFPRGKTASETFSLGNLQGNQWIVSIEAKAVGTLVDCSR
jgi:hypothetical protein